MNKKAKAMTPAERAEKRAEIAFIKKLNEREAKR